MKLLVAGIAFSTPAHVGNDTLATSAIFEWATLVMANVGCPRRTASRNAASVSAVSPDCEITTTAGFRFVFVDLQQYSLAYSTSTDSPAKSSSQISAASPACRLDPLAAITMSLCSRSNPPAGAKTSSRSHPSFT